MWLVWLLFRMVLTASSFSATSVQNETKRVCKCLIGGGDEAMSGAGCRRSVVAVV